MEAGILRVEDHGQMDNQRFAADVSDMPHIGILHVTKQYLLQVHPTLLFLSLLRETGNRRTEQHQQQEY